MPSISPLPRLTACNIITTGSTGYQESERLHKHNRQKSIASTYQEFAQTKNRHELIASILYQEYCHDHAKLMAWRKRVLTPESSLLIQGRYWWWTRVIKTSGSTHVNLVESMGKFQTTAKRTVDFKARTAWLAEQKFSSARRRRRSNKSTYIPAARSRSNTWIKRSLNFAASYCAHVPTLWGGGQWQGSSIPSFPSAIFFSPTP